MQLTDTIFVAVEKALVLILPLVPLKIDILRKCFHGCSVREHEISIRNYGADLYNYFIVGK